MNLTVSVSGLENIDEEFNAFRQKLNQQLTKAVRAMEGPLKDDLYVHIEEDVYAAYKPKEYPRRRDNPEFGIALNDMDKNAWLSILPQGNGFSFNYLPDGSHSGTTEDLDEYSDNYDADTPRPIKPNPVHGDDLIRRIETGRGYDWACYPGKREFWQNFVNEEMDGYYLSKVIPT